MKLSKVLALIASGWVPFAVALTFVAVTSGDKPWAEAFLQVWGLIVFAPFVALLALAIWLEVRTDTSERRTERKATALAGVFLLVICAVIGACGWLVIVFAADWFKYPEAQGIGQAEVALVGATNEVFGPDATVRIERRRGANVRVYVERKDYENIPFPDRDRAVTSLGEAWCGNVSLALMPSVSIRDIKNGDSLDGYSCSFAFLRKTFRDSNK